MTLPHHRDPRCTRCPFTEGCRSCTLQPAARRKPVAPTGGAVRPAERDGMKQCDFCFTWDPGTGFPAMPVRHHFAGDPEARIETRGPWLACSRCTFLIVRGQWADLTKRVLKAMLEVDPTYRPLRDVLREEVAALLQAFDGARMGSAQTLNAGRMT